MVFNRLVSINNFFLNLGQINLYPIFTGGFASAMRLERFTKRQLAGPKGKELILSYLLDEDNVSLAS